tara:strand:+ start:125 stop:394 length:270 start_codon:yes stop_codon:yes gene_type:complete
MRYVKRTTSYKYGVDMQIKKLIVLSTIALLSSACASGAKVGEECTADEDCAEGLECHLHDGEEDHGECEEHSDEEHEGEDHSDEEEAAE